MKKSSSPAKISPSLAVLLLLTTVPGIIGGVVFGYFAWQDWARLQRDYGYFSALIEQSASLEALFVAEAQQNVHRINLMADGIWALLSAILAAIGLHGACQPGR